MQSETYGSSQNGGAMPYTGAGTMSSERQFTDYVSDIGDTVSSQAGQVVNFVTERPLLIGSIVVGAIGAFTGSRIAQMMAERRRKTSYGKAVETLGITAALIGDAIARGTTSKSAKQLREKGRGLVSSRRDLRQSVMEGLPMVGRPKVQQPSAIKQIGYGLSLIPVTLALVRNPLIRDIGFRFLARRIRGRR